MDEQRQQAYTTLIDKFLATTKPEELEAILWQHGDLIDADLIKQIELVAANFDKRQSDQGEWLRNLAQFLIQYIENLQPTKTDFEFVFEVLVMIDNGAAREQVYTFLCQRLNKINERLARTLQIWADRTLPTLKSKQLKGTGYVIWNFSLFFLQFPRGNKANNVEIAIAGYQIVLSIFSQINLPKDWATNQYNLGVSYQGRIKGVREKNLELAINAYQNSLFIFTKLDFPKDWAKTHKNLGIVYESLGGKENLEKAISCYENALTERSRERYPADWTMIQHNLGVAYYDLGGRKNLEKAISCYQNVLQEYRRDKYPTDWAMIQHNLGLAYSNLGGRENLEKAISYYENALQEYRRDKYPTDWAMTQHYLGITYESLEGRKNIEKAIFYYKNALQERSRDEYPTDWASTQNSLGIAYRLLGGRENIEKAISCYENALAERSRERYPADWAMTQHNLGIAYESMGGRENIEKAISCYKNALTERSRERYPADWSSTKNSLGLAYYELGERENLERAISVFENVLSERPRDKYPYQWANTQSNMGLAYSELGGRENLERAISAFENALSERSRDEYSYQWASTQTNLGLAYSKLKGKENLEKSISYYENALTEWQRDKYPAHWAVTQNNLGGTYSELGGRENLERAICAFENALSERSQDEYPYQWAVTQKNLGITYSELGGRENIKRAICAFENARLILTPQSNPIECLGTAYNLGTLHVNQSNWQLAIDAYITAIEAVEQSREWASNDYNKQEIISNAISVYQNIVQACINTGQIDKALEYVEQGKARNLVDLIATRDLYPKGDIPQKIINRLDELRQKIIAEEKRLRQESNSKVSLNVNTSTEEDRDIAARTFQNAALNRTYLNNIRHELEQLVTEEIQPIDPGFQLTQRVEHIKFEQIQATLPNEQTALIEWFIGDGTLSAFIVTSNQPIPLHLDYNEKQFANLLETTKQYYNTYRQRDGQWHNELVNLLAQLAQNLKIDSIIEQIKAIVPDCTQIILVPHRWLHLLPIHALPVADGKCLLDLFPNGVSYAPSVQLLELTQKQAGKNLEIKQERNFFAVQNPTEDLKYTDIEVQTIRSQFTPNDEVLKKKEATKSALTPERLSLANFTHFSCHGSFNFEYPELSALHLANSKVEEKTEQDSIATAEKTRFLPDRDGSYIDLEQCLTLGEIFGLDLRNCSLVTLAACETGLTDFRSLSDEYIGLPSGFLYAGSPSVVSSLWAVDDLSTTFLMIKFYQNLQQMDSVPIALNQAQLWLRSANKESLQQWRNSLPKTSIRFYLDSLINKLTDDSVPFASPYYWAAFCAVGS